MWWQSFVVRLALFFVLLVATACEEEPQGSLTGFTPDSPSGKARFSRSLYGSGNDFSAGFQSGLLRSRRITLRWTAPAEAQYRAVIIFRDTQQLATITGRQTTRYVDSLGIQPENKYAYRLVTLFNSGLTAEDTISLPTPLFESPDQLRGQVIARSGEAIRLTWRNRTSAADRFQIDRRVTGGTTEDFVTVGEVSDTFFVDDNALTPGQFYDYQVIAKNNFESSKPSSQYSILTTYVLQSPNVSVLRQVPGARSVELEWQQVGNAEDEYRVYRRSANNDFVRIARVPATVFSFVDTDTLFQLQLDSTYFYAIAAYNSFENEEATASPPRSITIQAPGTFVGYSQDFELPLSAEWTFFSDTPEGQITRSQASSHGGSYMLLMDVMQTVVSNTNRATLQLDLSGIAQGSPLMLSFWYNTFEDEVNSFDEIIEVSSDGQSWTTVTALPQSINAWSRLEIDLGQFSSFQPFSNTYHIRWQQVDNFPYPMDGIGLDDITISLKKK